MLPRLTLILCLLALLPVSLTAQQPVPVKPDSQARVRTGVAALQKSYLQRTGLYSTTGWWNTANAITVLVDASRLTGSKQWTPVLANTFKKAQIWIPVQNRVGKLKQMTGFPGFINPFYDDEGWWALAWIDAYDLTGDQRYLAMSQSIFLDMTGGWDDVCGGGVWWKKDRKVKNAIENELFLSVAAHLATRVPKDKDYANWAQREWNWFRASGMINKQNLINDGLARDPKTGVCTNNGKPTWTYNNGVILGALAEWAKTSPDKTLLPEANRIATATLDHMTDANGILHEPCEPNCGADGVQFKGVFVRNLAALNRAAPNPRFGRFFQTNAHSIWTRDRNKQNQFGVNWAGPVSAVGAGAQSSALDVLVAAAAK